MNKIKSSSQKDSFYQSLVEIRPVFLEQKTFKVRQCIFVKFEIISPWKKAVILICKILVTQEFFVQSLVEIGQAVLKKIFSTMYFRYFVIISPWK